VLSVRVRGGMTAVLEAREARRAVARWWGVALEEYGAVAPQDVR